MRELQFRNNTDTYRLDDNWKFDLSDYTRRLDLSSRFSRNGSNVYGDRTSDARNMRFTYQLPTENDTDNITFLSGLERFFDIVNFPFFLEDIGNGRRCAIEIDRLGSVATADGNRKRLENVTLGVVMLDAEWEDLTETVETATLTSGASLVCTNNGRLVFAVVEIESLGSITEFSLFNTTNSSGLIMSLPSFETGEKIILDGRNGRVTKDGVDQSFNITEGGLISLNPDANIIQYSSGTGSAIVTVKWRQVYAY